mgnify:CR=1 FL=1
MTRALIIIPARMASTRLPDKPLADIEGEPMIVRVWRQAHAAEMGAEVDRSAPFYFTKSPAALVIGGGVLPYPPGTADLHHEVELVVAIGAVSWPAPARLTRAEVLSLRNREFVLACRTLGMGDLRLILFEVLPNALPPVIVYASVVMAVAILLESALAFLGLSDANVASWGNLIGTGRTVIRSEWYVSAIPGVAILLTVLAVSLVGQGLNDALNPRLKERS